MFLNAIPSVPQGRTGSIPALGTKFKTCAGRGFCFYPNGKAELLQDFLISLFHLLLDLRVSAEFAFYQITPEGVQELKTYLFQFYNLLVRCFRFALFLCLLFA